MGFISQVHRSTDGANWSLVREENSIWHDFQVSRHDAARIYLFLGRLQRSEDGGSAWEVLEETGYTPRYVAESLIDEQVLYGTQHQGFFELSADGGRNWLRLLDLNEILGSGLHGPLATGEAPDGGTAVFGKVYWGENQAYRVTFGESSANTPAPPAWDQLAPFTNRLDFGQVGLGAPERQRLELRLEAGSSTRSLVLTPPIDTKFVVRTYEPDGLIPPDPSTYFDAVDTSKAVSPTPLRVPAGDPIRQNARIFVGASEPTVVEVEYQPSLFATDTSSVTLRSGLTNGLEFQVALEGYGDRPAELVLSRTDVAFDTVIVGNESQLSVLATNTGAVALKVTGIEVGAPFAARWSGMDAPFTSVLGDTTVIEGDSLWIEVRYLPTEAAPHRDTLSFSTNDPSTLNVRVPLAGVALPPPALELVPRRIDWPTVFVGQRDSQMVIVRNDGQGQLELTLAGASTPDLMWAGTLEPIRLGPGADTTLVASYAPTRDGISSAALRLTSNQPGRATDSVIVDLHPHHTRVLLDLDEAEGNQALDSLSAVSRNRDVQLQIYATGLPAIGGFSLRLRMSQTEIELDERFETGDLFGKEDLSGAVRPTEDGAEAVFASLEGTRVDGDGWLGTARFRILDGFSGRTEVTVTQISLHTTSGEEVSIPIRESVILTGEPGGVSSDFDGNGVVDVWDFFLFSDQYGKPVTEENAKFDLNGNGEISLEDFYRFAADFGKKLR